MYQNLKFFTRFTHRPCKQSFRMFYIVGTVHFISLWIGYKYIWKSMIVMLWNALIFRLFKNWLSPNNKMTKTLWIHLSGFKIMRGKMKNLQKIRRNYLKGMKIIHVHLCVYTLWLQYSVFWILEACNGVINTVFPLPSPTTNVLACFYDFAS